MTRNRVLFVLLLVAAACGCALAQTTGATLLGTVNDSSQGAVPNVAVELKNVATGVVRATLATSEGIFRFNGVIPAVYDLAIRPPAGFKEYVQEGLSFRSADVPRVDISLELGSVSESVTVAAVVPS